MCETHPTSKKNVVKFVLYSIGKRYSRVGYDMRIIFDFVKSEEQVEDDILLLEIGTHDEVY